MTLQEFINYGIRMTAAFLDYQKDLLTADFDMLLMKDKLFSEYDTLQYLYLMESKDNMRIPIPAQASIRTLCLSVFMLLTT